MQVLSKHFIYSNDFNKHIQKHSFQFTQFWFFLYISTKRKVKYSYKRQIQQFRLIQSCIGDLMWTSSFAWVTAIKAQLEKVYCMCCSVVMRSLVHLIVSAQPGIKEQSTVTHPVNSCEGFIIPTQPALRQDQSRHRRSPRGRVLTPSALPSPPSPTTMINDFTLSTQRLSSFFSLLLLYQAYFCWYFF